MFPWGFVIVSHVFHQERLSHTNCMGSLRSAKMRSKGGVQGCVCAKFSLVTNQRSVAHVELTATNVQLHVRRLIKPSDPTQRRRKKAGSV